MLLFNYGIQEHKHNNNNNFQKLFICKLFILLEKVLKDKNIFDIFITFSRLGMSLEAKSVFVIK